MNKSLENGQEIALQPGIVRRKQTVAKIGVFGVAYCKYWEQFEGLLEDMKSKQSVFKGLQPMITKKVFPDKGIFYRLQAGPLASEPEAHNL